MHKVTIRNSGHSFEVRPSQTVLQAAIEAGVNLPYGCRNGACGACKATLIQGKVMHDGNMAALKQQAVQDGMRPLRLAGALQVAEGHTVIGEVISSTPPLV